MSSPPLPKTGKTKLNRLRNILGRKTSSQHSTAGTSISKLSNSELNAPGLEKDTSQDDNLPAHPTISGFKTGTATDTLISPQPFPSSHQLPSFNVNSDSKARASDKLKKSLSVAWNGLETALRLLERSADAFPPLKSAVGGLVAFLDLGDAVAENDEEYEKIATELTSVAETLIQRVPALVVEGVSGSVARIMESISAESTHIKQQQDRNKIMRTVTAIQDQGDVVQRYRRIESLFRQLQSDFSLRNWDDIRKIRETGLLEKMSPVYEALYNSGYSKTVNRGGCTAETREKVLEDLKGWVGDSNGAKIYWMNGMAGTGKTTISYTLCEWLQKNSQLGGNYFCSRTSALCRNVDNIVPTLAYQLALYSHSFRSSLCNVLEEEPGACKLDVYWQFKKLIQKPLQAIKTAMPENVAFVIDALDECDDSSTFRLFLDTLLNLAVNLPIKFLITSRPEPAIRDKMLSSQYSHSILYLHNIEESIVSADIRKYLTEALGFMSPVPSSHDLERLVNNAGKLFIYAATAVRYICPGDPNADSGPRFQTMLGMVSGLTHQYDDLNELYMNILSGAINPPKRREAHEITDIILILKTVICAKEPMNIRTLASLLSLTEKRVRFALQPLQSVLHTREGVEELIAPFHSSFPDFLFDEHRSKQFYCEITLYNEALANDCLCLMEEKLRFNICDLESSFVLDEDVPDLPERIQHSISPALSYACRYWGIHLVQGVLTDTVHGRLVDFLTNRLLFWMEVINLEQRIMRGNNMLGEIINQLKSKNTSLYSDTIEQLKDAQEFISHLALGHKASIPSTPHIYISGLAFCPRTSFVYKNYRGHTLGLLDVKKHVMKKWGRSRSRPEDEIYSVAYSPDGAHIVSGSEDMTVRIWDARTGAAVAGPFNGHTYAVYSVAFSLDGARIASGSGDGTIRVWDARTGEVVAGPYRALGYPIMSVALSPDGAHVTCSSCGGNLLRLWDTHTGEATEMKGHTGQVLSVAFSPNGDQIASGSWDDTVRVWDAHTGESVAGPFMGHRHIVLSVAFSPDGTRIASGSGDWTIRVWDTQTGNPVAGPFEGHNNKVSSVAFSPDGTRIVSGSDDTTILVWDAFTGDIVAGPFNGHTQSVSSVSFSPDGIHILSSSETIRIWDAYAGLIPEHMNQAPTGDSLNHSLFSHSNLSVKRYSVYNKFITADDDLLFDVPLKFLAELLYAGNILAFGPTGGVVSNIDFSKLFIGKTWSQCYI